MIIDNVSSLVYGSVCSGIEAASEAWEPLGWRAAFFAEIEDAPSAVLAARWPHVRNLGDFTKIGDDVGSIDVLVGGTPCQSFSIAGLRKGLGDSRGNLALEFLFLLKRLRPRWVVWENVPGVFSATSHDAPDPCPPAPPVDLELDGQVLETGDDYTAEELHAFSCFLAGLQECGYGFAYRVLDAQHFGVPQRRRRVFVVGHLGELGRSTDSGEVWDTRKAALLSAAVLFERYSLSGNPAPRREAGQRVAPPIAGVSNGGGANGPGRTADDAEAIVTTGTLHGRLDRQRADDAYAGHIVAVANPLTARMGKGVNTTLDEGQTIVAQTFEQQTVPPLIASGAGFSRSGNETETEFVVTAQAFKPSHFTCGKGDQEPVIFVPDVADPICANEQRTYTHEGSANFRTRNVIAFDTTQITHPENRSNPQPGNHAPARAPGAHPPAIAFSCNDYAQDAGETAPTLRSMNEENGNANGGGQIAVFDERTITSPENRMNVDPRHVAPTIHEKPLSLLQARPRRLTPRECERLQGFEDDHTLVKYRGAPMKDGPRYKSLGNAFAVVVVRWIGERIDQVEAVLRELATKNGAA